MDPMLFPPTPAEPPARDPETLDLFAPATPPDLGERLPVPVAPGSQTSEDAAADVDAQRELRRVLTWFAAQSEPRTRHDCADALYPYTGGIGPACGRINTLIFVGCLEEVGRNGRRATLQITAKGRAKVARLLGAAA